MAKRKRQTEHQDSPSINGNAAKTPRTESNGHDGIKATSVINGTDGGVSVNGSKPSTTPATATATATAASLPPLGSQHQQTIQIITGSYEAVLHGITATISPESESEPEFSDTFLFKAHASSIRCLGLSPLPNPNSEIPQGVYLATGSSDERVNVYSLSASPLPQNDRLPSLPTLSIAKLRENPANRELGNIVQHSAPITSLHFPSRSKLLSASEDNTIAVTRTRDLEVVSSIRAPRPKIQGQPTGDTAPPGMTPMGVNDFAVHPSMKLMVTVGKGEKCMRLWNLVTGKKAGVLNFDRKILESIKEGKYSSGEGRKIEWDGQGQRFAVAFERGLLVYNGQDSRVHCRVSLWPTKVCQMRWVDLGQEDNHAEQALAVSTEDGRLVFFDVSTAVKTQHTDQGDKKGEDVVEEATVLGQLGGKETGQEGRIKDFEILTMTTTDEDNQAKTTTIAVTAASDGAVRIWRLSFKDPSASTTNKEEKKVTGNLLGTYETGNRITCLRAFVMQPAREEDEGGLSEFEGLTSAAEESSSDESDED